MTNEVSNMNSAKALVDDLLAAKKELVLSKKIMDKKDKHIYPISKPPFAIPNKWQWVFLSDISIIQEGPGIRKHQYEDDGMQFLTVTNILEGSVDLLKSQKYISIEEYEKKYQHFTINKGDIVTACSGASWGKSAIYEYEQQLMLNTSTLRLRFFNDLGNNRYLYFLTKSDYFKANLASHSTGQQANYGYSHYSKIPIPIPSFNEQKQIVALLDQAFTSIDQAKANIEKNIANAKELFQSKLNEIFSQKGDGWEEKTLGEDCVVSMGQSPKGTTYNSEGIGTPLINGPVEFGREPFSKTIMSKWTTKPTKLCEEGDLILCVRGSTTGRINIAGFEACIGRGVASIRYKKNQEWINFFIRCNQKNIFDLGTGSTFPNVSSKILSQLKFSEPKSLQKQNELILVMKKLESDVNRITFNYEKKNNDLDDLKKSLLQKAFAGELTQTKVTA